MGDDKGKRLRKVMTLGGDASDEVERAEVVKLGEEMLKLAAGRGLAVLAIIADTDGLTTSFSLNLAPDEAVEMTRGFVTSYEGNADGGMN